MGAPSFARLGGFDRFPPSWANDWTRFGDLEERPVGGRIVAETMVGLLEDDSSSFLDVDTWTPSLAVNGTFGLRELVAAAITEPV